jgi:hypothetical protein
VSDELIYEVSAILSETEFRLVRPGVAPLNVAWARLERELRGYPGISFKAEVPGPFPGSLILRLQKVPLSVAMKRWEREKARRRARGRV